MCVLHNHASFQQHHVDVDHVFEILHVGKSLNNLHQVSCALRNLVLQQAGQLLLQVSGLQRSLEGYLVHQNLLLCCKIKIEFILFVLSVVLVALDKSNKCS